MESIIDKYKKSRSRGANVLLDKIKEKLDKKTNYGDDRIWKYTKDKSGNAFAIIRFLPNKNPDDLPMTQTFEHSFQNVGKWYIEGCPTTIKGGTCAVCENNSEYYAVSKEHGKKNVASKGRSRTKYFYSNILIIKDDACPDNVGKVMLLKYGEKVKEKIMEKLQPSFDGEEPVEVFDLFEGANFKLKIKTVKGVDGTYPDYSQCSFAEQTPVSEDEKELESILNRLYDVNEFSDPKAFKSYDDLKKRFEKVMGVTQTATVEETETETTETNEPVETENSVEVETKNEETESKTDSDDTDDYFNDM